MDTSEPIRAEKGSPPRMRGKEIQLKKPVTRLRITPAHAGKRIEKEPPDKESWDHPRACGEKDRKGQTLFLVPGSPPRMRGKAMQLFVMLGGLGITPAHAGKSPQNRSSGTNSKDHPRACGEKAADRSGRFGRTGSPPRMRGKVISWRM